MKTGQPELRDYSLRRKIAQFRLTDFWGGT
jgi:hypothetical protein